MPDRPTVNHKRAIIGPIHKHPEGYRDHVGRPTTEATPRLGGLAKEIKDENKGNNATTGMTVVLLVLGLFALYAIFYR